MSSNMRTRVKGRVEFLLVSRHLLLIETQHRATSIPMFEFFISVICLDTDRESTTLPIDGW